MRPLCSTFQMLFFAVLLSVIAGCNSRAEEPAPEQTGNAYLEMVAERAEKTKRAEEDLQKEIAERAKARAKSRGAATRSSNQAAGQPQLPPDPIRDKLVHAWEVWTKGVDSLESEINPLLRSMADSFPEISVSTQPADVKWQTIKLFENGRPLDAVRFRSPLKEKADMFWIYVREPGDFRWFIVSRDGPMQGFEDDRPEQNVEFEDLVTPAYNSTVFQSLREGAIEPGKEYLLWFASFEGARARDLNVSILLVPAGSIPETREPAELAKAMGKKLIEFPSIEPGIDLSKKLGGTRYVSFAPDGKTVAVNGNGDKIQIVNLETFEVLGDFIAGPSVALFDFSPDGSTLAVLEQNTFQSGVVTLWDVQSRMKTDTLPDNLSRAVPGQTRYVIGMEFTPDGKRLILLYRHDKSSRDTSIDFVSWDISARKVIGKSEYEMRWPMGIRLLPGERIAVLTRAIRTDEELKNSNFPRPDEQSFVSIHDTQTMKKLEEFELSEKDVSDFDISNDGSKMLTATSHSVSLWDFPARKILRTKPQGSFATEVRFASDGKLAVVGRADGTLRVWDVESDKLIRAWSPYKFGVRRLTVSPDGKQIASVSRSGTRIHLVDREALAQQDSAHMNSIGMPFRRIPAGRFVMGAKRSDPYAQSDERPAHRVEISRDFEIGTFEVTIGQFRKFVDETKYVTACEKDVKGGNVISQLCGWEQKAGVNWQNPGYEHTDNHPVAHVNWYDAQAFCEWLSKKEGATYRLPTEAEWEYACRAGSNARLSNARDDESFDAAWEIMNLADLSARAVRNRCDVHEAWDDHFPDAAPVGSFDANAFGLCDMYGNVREWCQDWLDTYLAQNVTDPQGAASGSMRMTRGGSYSTVRNFCRSSARNEVAPSEYYPNLGFRIVRVVK